jgi:hypothetical protein
MILSTAKLLDSTSPKQDRQQRQTNKQELNGKGVIVIEQKRRMRKTTTERGVITITLIIQNLPVLK